MCIVPFNLSQTAVAASVDLRCYGLSTPRNDGRLSVHFADIDNFYHEWDIDSLPWDAVTPLAAGEDHPEVLDQVLMDAICAGPLSGFGEDVKHAKTASLAFLYMYLMLSHGRRWADLVCFPAPWLTAHQVIFQLHSARDASCRRRPWIIRVLFYVRGNGAAPREPRHYPPAPAPADFNGVWVRGTPRPRIPPRQAVHPAEHSRVCEQMGVRR